MLVLSRKENEEIYLTLPDGQRIRVVVLKRGHERMGRGVRLGIDAPDEVEIERKEIYERRMKVNK